MYKKVTAIILAGGCGKRMGGGVAKQFLTFCGVSVIERSIAAFSLCTDVEDLVIVSREEDLSLISEIAEKYPKIKRICIGGISRAESAKNGFFACDTDTDIVAIHDAARCLITPEMISKVIKTAVNCGAATAATPVFDTLKRVNNEGVIVETVNREGLWSAQTPQVFSYGVYKEAIEKYYDENATDDNSLVEHLGIPIKMVDTGKDNIKITVSDDLILAQYIINKREKN